MKYVASCKYLNYSMVLLTSGTKVGWRKKTGCLQMLSRCGSVFKISEYLSLLLPIGVYCIVFYLSTAAASNFYPIYSDPEGGLCILVDTLKDVVIT
ncbi:unnamed protein product [Allacma fusca]|uniref:Uncharacterized protein n=1 Tax=Allacma fusca TaxID=39272 RepID=A0A8J2K2M1_9HEXA|nr:unnamed protein product [Allacma fusca]